MVTRRNQLWRDLTVLVALLGDVILTFYIVFIAFITPAFMLHNPEVKAMGLEERVDTISAYVAGVVGIGIVYFAVVYLGMRLLARWVRPASRARSIAVAGIGTGLIWMAAIVAVVEFLRV